MNFISDRVRKKIYGAHLYSLCNYGRFFVNETKVERSLLVILEPPALRVCYKLLGIIVRLVRSCPLIILLVSGSTLHQF